MGKYKYFMDKQGRLEVGYALWKLRQEKGLTLNQASIQMNIPLRIIDSHELGRIQQYTTMRKMSDFYGKKMKISFE